MDDDEPVGMFASLLVIAIGIGSLAAAWWFYTTLELGVMNMGGRAALANSPWVRMLLMGFAVLFGVQCIFKGVKGFVRGVKQFLSDEFDD
ncbi:MAG: hypothetical protein FWG81_05210 [Betaproteobacteria bacterium]|nr:hypothetical protein [Betaproteobacteria bacterium]